MSDISKETLQTITSIAESLERLEHAASSMAQASIASVVYPSDTLQSLFSEFKSLCDARTDAHNGVRQAINELTEKLGVPEFGDYWSLGALRVKFGDDKAAIQYEGVAKAIEIRNETTKAYDLFREKHPLVAALHTKAQPD